MEKLIDIRVIDIRNGVKKLVVDLSDGGAGIMFENNDTAVDVVRKLHEFAEMLEYGALARAHRMKAPWLDFAGKAIYAGDVVRHPSGQTGTVLYLSTGRDSESQWLVDYGDVTHSRLILQIGEKGRAVVVASPPSI